MSITATATAEVNEIERLARRFETQPVEALLEWAVERFAPKLAMTSSFGAEGIVLLDKLARIAPRTPILYLDTGYHFAETTQLKAEMQARYGLNIVELRAELSVAQQDAQFGEKLYERDPDACCRMRKVEPLRRALAGYDAWIAALRRDASPTRAGIAKVEWSARHNAVKLNPIADWSRRDVWDYIVRHGLPYNRLHDEGYTSIGCQPCTRIAAAGEHERSGRWVGRNKLECGIHL
jgi:phosphoadenosine phosphosulfate reductase